ncbi:hypothetical protein [Candidatus Parabeggiatoa sp. HSG14]|uniref:hypothetical protein n=1 Tax=Candidatus Parabeggiatoa sp. HSG14 TaxID=3055593 RepID=UPI0025A873FD|nr:hypothetical protein [Thiotrichales bacterium HSG14]
MLTFKECTLLKLEKTFNLQQVRTHKILQEWLSGTTDISEKERINLLDLKELLIDNVDDWNEQELSLHFIGPLFTFVNFSTKHFNAFAERKLSSIVEGVEMLGKPDGMIASGRREPEIPYFCFQEYKKEKDAEGDPAAQALAAMLVAQTLNKGKRPVYGCYVRGRNWFFMVLQGKTFCISQNYSSTKDEIFDIFKILKVLKQKIIEMVESQS